MIPDMSKSSDFSIIIFAVLTTLFLFQITPKQCHSSSFEGVNIVSGILESPQFKGKELTTRLSLVSDLVIKNKLSKTDSSYFLLDWVDQYLREPPDPAERLKRWSDFCNNEKFSNLKVPRDFLNRALVCEYLNSQPAYLKASPQKKLEMLRYLQKKNLLDWSVALSYENLIAGVLIFGAKPVENPAPLDSLATLKKLRDENLVGNHYTAMMESLLAHEALSQDIEYLKAAPMERLVKLRDLEKKGLITHQTKKELEKLPAWRLFINDPGFLRLEASKKRSKILKLKNDGLLTSSTSSDLVSIFKGAPTASSPEPKPSPIP